MKSTQQIFSENLRSLSIKSVHTTMVRALSCGQIQLDCYD